MDRDVVLVTVDALRYDAVEDMPYLGEWISDGDGSSFKVVCNSCATNAVFPAILSSQYHFEAYDGSGQPRKGLRPLPAVLGDYGYETAAFIGSNPHLLKWEPYFDHYYNPVPRDARSNAVELIKNLALLRKQVPGQQLVDDALSWFAETDGPRFLWVHLMEPHTPYHPGLRSAYDIGLTRSYLAMLRYHLALYRASATSDHIHPVWKNQLRQLYWRCVQRTDRIVTDLLTELPSDATVLVMGDHGESLSEDPFNHSTLAESVVTTPGFARLPGTQRLDFPREVTQLDIPATILDAHSIPVPDQWEGEPVPRENDEGIYMGARIDRHGRYLVGHRTKTRKVVMRFDVDSREELSRNRYAIDGISDRPLEESDENSAGPPSVQSVKTFAERMLSSPLFETGERKIGKEAESRLKQLGYIDN